jgi:hypothetical protein
LIKIATVIAHIVPKPANCDVVYKNANKVSRMTFSIAVRPSCIMYDFNILGTTLIVKIKWEHGIKPSDNAKLKISFSWVFNRPFNDKRIIIVEEFNKIPKSDIVRSIAFM